MALVITLAFIEYVKNIILHKTMVITVNLPNRNRLKNFNDNQNGAYFVTVCVRDRKQILCHIAGDDTHIVAKNTERSAGKNKGKDARRRLFLYSGMLPNIFSMKMPYPRVGSSTKTWVTAPISFPFCSIKTPDTSVLCGLEDIDVVVTDFEFSDEVKTRAKTTLFLEVETPKTQR